MKFNTILIAIVTLCLLISCSENEDNVHVIYPKGVVNIDITTDINVPKNLNFDNIYSAYTSRVDSNHYKVFIEAESDEHKIWVQGIIPVDEKEKIDINTGLGIYGKNKKTGNIDLTYQAYNVKLTNITEPQKMGDLLVLKLNGWFYEKRPQDQLLNIDNARKRQINIKNLSFQLVENILEAKKQIENL